MKDSFSAQLGEAVRKRRRALGLSQDDLALLAGVSRRPVTLLESNKGDLRLSTLESILTPLGLTVEVVPAATILPNLAERESSERNEE